MIKMKLPMRTAEEGGDDTTEEEQEKTDRNLHFPSSVSNRLEDSINQTRGLGYPLLQLDKEAVFEWFGLHLNPAKRIEFMCGLLHMCQPLELRFLGSCLEDLARKDFHVLRDFETRANSPSELGLLTDVTDPVVRSKLLVCLSLLGSENRECAGILFRILSHVDSALYFKNYGFPLSSFRSSEHLQLHPPCEGGDETGGSEQRCGPPEAGFGPLEQLALLFTMASFHPAFPFHQRENVRMQLEKVKTAIEEERQHYKRRTNALPAKGPKPDYLSPSSETRSTSRAQSPPTSETPARVPSREAVHIERIVLKGISRRRTEREYSFEVKWSDCSSTSVTKTHHELEDFLLKLPKESSSDSFEKGILTLLRHGDQCEGRDLEQTLREKFLLAPQSFCQTGRVCGFFLSDRSRDSCSHCNTAPLSPPVEQFKQDCSETSSPEEDPEPYLPGHRVRHGSRSPGLSARGVKGCPEESRRTSHAEQNGLGDWSGRAALGPQQRLAEDKRSGLPGNKSKGRLGVADREKEKKGEGQVGRVCNGLLGSPPPAQTKRRPTETGRPGKAGSRQDTGGETSSSSSTPSSPQRDGRESLDSEDEDDKDRDTDSNSDDFLSGAAVVPVTQECPLTTPTFPPFPLVTSLQYVSQNGTVPPQAAEGKAAGAQTANAPRQPLSGPADAEKHPPDSTPLPPAFSPPLQPLVQRFKTGPSPHTAPKSSPSPLHRPPVGTISVIPPGPSPTVTTEATAPPPAFTGGATGTPAAGQVQATPLPAVPTHTPNPAPIPSPALTHSAAQSDSTSYISSSSSGSSGGTSQQQPPPPPQQIGCGACGCRGHAPSFYFPPQLARQVLGVPPIFHLPSLCGGSYLSQALQTNGAAQLPFFPYAATPLLHAPSPSEHVLAGAQPGYALQQMAAFGRFYPPVFPALGGVVPGAGGGVASAKKNGNVSCYNCGASGHYAQDCKQPSADAAQQGGFRLKYVATHSPEALDKGD
ncbi:hypothetical protein MATL_G00256820 [Megalops atlanticus]|uniref:CCHC-type domain-containing protein n=1 Tax=Megalops atlanticus TaxID=7932 RepID=A0A9D3PDV2_MEGAT|nr:hypothetical protein MATL_G00256820 [Megalops atlanticus]